MFTIKHITKAGETLWEGRGIHYSRTGDRGLDSATGRPTVIFDDADGLQCSIDSGAVYVMNAAGNTVSNYHLEGSPEYPHGKW